MLKSTFIHIPGIGPAAERKLWDKGLLDWDRLERAVPELYTGDKALTVSEFLRQSNQAYVKRDLHYFYRSFPRDALWRLVPECLDGVAYLDIETTGMGHPPQCESTTITFYFRGEVYQEHEHAKKEKLIRWILEECTMICTFFGESFDVPFLTREYGIPFKKAHIDLCFWLKRLGYKGGLKRVQKLFKDIPERQSLDIDGFDAVRLWRLHERGMSGALETLLTYNAEDTVVLEPLLVKAYNLELERNKKVCPPELLNGLKPLEMKPLPELKTKSHRKVYDHLRGLDV